MDHDLSKILYKKNKLKSIKPGELMSSLEMRDLVVATFEAAIELQGKVKILERTNAKLSRALNDQNPRIY